MIEVSFAIERLGLAPPALRFVYSSIKSQSPTPTTWNCHRLCVSTRKRRAFTLIVSM